MWRTVVYCNASRGKKLMTPLSSGRYWYDTLGLPTGVRAELVQMHDGSPGVRFCFTSFEQATLLAQAVAAFASSLGDSNRVAALTKEVEPPEVGENAG